MISEYQNRDLYLDLLFLLLYCVVIIIKQLPLNSEHIALFYDPTKIQPQNRVFGP